MQVRSLGQEDPLEEEGMADIGNLKLSFLIATRWRGPGQRSRAFPIYKTKLIQLKETYNNGNKII